MCVCLCVSMSVVVQIIMISLLCSFLSHTSELIRLILIGFTYGSTSHNWPRIRDWARQHNKLFILSVGPGYNDIPVRPWNSVNRRARDNGTYYRRMFEAAAAARPDVISITSFNEWGEVRCCCLAVFVCVLLVALLFIRRWG